MKIDHRDEAEKDVLLIHQTLLGNKAAFEKLVNKYSPAVYALVLSYVKNADDAEDLTQEVFIKAYENLARLENHEQFSSWLWQIARNHCIDQLRRQKETTISLEEIKGAEPPSRTPSPDEIVLWKELIKTVRQAVDSLSEIEKRLLKSYYLEGASYEQLQREHNLSYFAVAHHLQRAKQKVRKTVQKQLKGLGVLPWREAFDKLLLGGVKAVKLPLKTKVIIVGTAVVIGFGGAGAWYLHSKSDLQSSMVQQEINPKKEEITLANPKITIPKSEPNDFSQMQSQKLYTPVDVNQEKVSESEEISGSLETTPSTSSTWMKHNHLAENQKEENQMESITVEQSITDVLTRRFIAAYESENIEESSKG